MSSAAQRPTAHLVEALRKLMAERGLNAFFVTSADPHMSEYVPEHFRCRQFLTGFTGSAGTAVVTQDKALLWTDGRYHVQAANELQSPPWVLMKTGVPEVPTVEKWLLENLGKNAVIGFDAWSMSAEEHDRLSKAMAKRSKQGIRFQPADASLVAQLWDQETDPERKRPPMPSSKVFAHPLKYCGKSVSDKLLDIQKDLRKEGLNRLLITALDDIAWLLNLRGSDVPMLPVFLAYCVVEVGDPPTATLFIDPAKIDPAIIQDLESSKVQVRPYESITAALAEEPLEDIVVGYDPDQCSVKLLEILKANPKVQCSPLPSVVAAVKAVKNETELEGMKNSHIRDAAALINYLIWLEDELAKGTTITETSGADRLEEFRRVGENFVSLSFETISAVGPSAALPHYRPPAKDSRQITTAEIYLVDSGAQYRDGTTDITRTVHFGTPTEKEVECFTRVLKGHIALSTAIFPNTTVGFQLDTFARQHLWEQGLNYLHGTGHGVGSFLSVHEGPSSCSIGHHQRCSGKVKASSVVSNEPGYYEEGKFGIRIENLCYYREVETKYKSPGVSYLTLEPLTLVPIQKKLIDASLLTDKELKWLNDYHANVLEKVGPLLSDTAKEWLRRECSPIVPQLPR
eukprot:RCo050894